MFHSTLERIAKNIQFSDENTNTTMKDFIEHYSSVMLKLSEEDLRPILETFVKKVFSKYAYESKTSEDLFRELNYLKGFLDEAADGKLRSRPKGLDYAFDEYVRNHKNSNL
jgi:hypothetical protein